MIKDFLSRINPFKKQIVENYNGKNIVGSGGAEKVDYILNEYDKAIDYFRDDRDRENEAWRLYHGINYGQWTDEAVSNLLNEGRHPGQYNFIYGKIGALVGAIIKNWYDVDYVPVDGKYSDFTKILKDLYYSDKEMMDWEDSYRQFVVDYFVFSGTEEMYISQRYSPLGNIGFRRVLPGHIIYDPDWVTDNGWDIKKCWKIAYLTAQEIKDKYNSKGDEIDFQIKLLKNNGKSYESTDFDAADLPYLNQDPIYGSKFRVIEEHTIKEEKEKVEVVMDATGQVHQVPVGDDEYKRDWAVLNDIDFSNGVIEYERPVSNYYIETIAPELIRTSPLEDRMSVIQIGRVPFFKASSARVNGKDAGFVELFKDAQQSYNKRESLIEDIIANSAGGGFFIDPDLVGNDYEKMRKIKKSWNNPSFKEFTKPGELASGRRHIEELPRSQFPSDAVNQIGRMADVIDRIGKVPAVWDARSEGSEETGILYARKQQQADINITLESKVLEYHWNQKGEAYMLMAPVLYSGVYREFKHSGKNETFALNEEVQTPNGNVTKNDISKMPRHKVIISQSPQGTTYREVQRAVNAELLRVIPTQNPISRAKAVMNVMKTLDMTTEDREEYIQSAKLEELLAVESTKAQIMSLKMQQQQAAMQMQMGPQQMMAQGEGQEPPKVSEQAPQGAQTPIK